MGTTVKLYVVHAFVAATGLWTSIIQAESLVGLFLPAWWSLQLVIAEMCWDFNSVCKVVVHGCLTWSPSQLVDGAVSRLLHRLVGLLQRYGLRQACALKAHDL